MRALAGVALVLGALAVAQVALAQPADDDRYRTVIEHAVAAMDAGRYEDALGLFQEAHGLRPSARTHRGIGIARYQMRDFVGAVRSLRLALTSSTNPLTAEMRAEAERLVGEASGFVAVLVLRVEPADAEVLLDGVPIEREPDGTALANAGPHRIVIRRAGYQETTQEVSLTGGNRRELTAALTPVAEGPGPGPGPGPIEPSEPRSAVPAIAILSTGGGFLLGALGSIAWVRGRSEEIDRCRAENEDGTFSTGCANANALENQRRTALAATFTMMALGVGLLSAGLVLLLSRGGGSGEQADAGCRPGPTGLVCTF